ncbi:LamG domain-containing protein [Actinosynnema sp. CS-041913]|uniref:LamG domain-containing protein n=1 Tax=Actinosynnema sp. CS-041913 TaxID=3239917 RepID=UPI003D8E1366
MAVRERTKAWVRFGAAVALLAGVLTASPPALAAPTEQPDNASASAAARRFGRQVEVAGLRSPTTQVFANPSGSLTAVVNAQPVRVRRADGGWVPVDTALRRADDGTVSATASPLAARLSGGGHGPLVSAAAGSAELSLAWPGPLPAPVLSGDTATYPEVLPGVDLTARLAVDGFDTALVVKNAAAAANPALRRITFRTTTRGLSLRPGPAGTSVAVAPDGAEVFRSGGAGGTATALEVGTDSLAVQSAPPPDAVYPLVVAPVTTVQAANWTMINERHPDQSYWSHDRAQNAKVGYVEQAGDGWERYRSIWTFPMGALQGKHVLRAWFSSYLKHTYSCADSWTDLYVVNSVDPATTWANHNGSWTRYLGGALNSDCHDTGRYSEWGGDKVTAAAQDATGWGTLTLGLRAGDEGRINAGWKKFDENRTALSVEYNSYPKAPDLLSVEGRPCTAAPVYVGTTTPTLRARPRDEDGQVHETWFAYGERASSGGQFLTWHSTPLPNIPEGAVAQHRIPQALGDGKLFAFHSQSNDGIDAGAKSDFCEFVVDVTRPAAPPGIDTADGRYPSDGAIHGGVGVSGDFTFTAAGVTDVAGYLVGIADPPAEFVPATTLGGAATAGVTPEWRGSNTVYVRSVDRAGNQSDTARHDFRVGSGRPPVGRWSLAEAGGAALADSSGNGRAATLTAGTLGVPGRLVGGPTALGLSGGSAATATAAVDTAQSFSVAAWVRSTGTGQTRTAVTQEGSRVGGFALQQTGDRWAFSMPHSDTDGTAATVVTAPEPPRVGVWTHLAGTYDTATRKLTLYVDGRKAAEKVAPVDAWPATGPLVIGRGQAGGGAAASWLGELADVRVWDRRIYLSEVTELANELTTVGDWRFDEPSGVTMTDSSGFGRSVTFPGGTHPGWGRAAGHDGTGSSLATGGIAGTTAGPVVRSTTGFAVAAWVRIEAHTAGWQAAVAADGTRVSPFFLQYSATSRKWAFAVTGSDVDNPAQHRAYSQREAVPGTWVHLVGVHDPGAKQVKLYVDGQLDSTVSAPSSWDAPGGVTIGRGKWNGAPSDRWYGGVDDVRILAGVPTELDIVSLYHE